jgi:hypothetical protein
VAGVTRELGSSEWREIEVLARVPRDCQEAGLARSVPREESAEGWAAGVLAGVGSQCWLVAGRAGDDQAGVECLAELNAAEVRHGSRVRWRVGMSYEGSLGGGSLQETGARPKHHEATRVSSWQQCLNARYKYGK